MSRAPKRAGSDTVLVKTLKGSGVGSFRALPVKGKARPEVKHFDYSGVDWDGSTNCWSLTDLERGDRDDERMTPFITPKLLTFSFKVSWSAPFDSRHAHWRLTIFSWRPYAVTGQSPSAHDILDLITGSPDADGTWHDIPHVIAPYRIHPDRNFKILYDSAGTLTASLPGAGPAIGEFTTGLTKIAIPLVEGMHFRDNNSPLYGGNKIWFCFQSKEENVIQQQVTPPRMTFTSRLSYCDKKSK